MSGKSNEFARSVMPVKSEIRILWPHLFYNCFSSRKESFLRQSSRQNGIGQLLFMRQTILIYNWKVSESYSVTAYRQLRKYSNNY